MQKNIHSIIVATLYALLLLVCIGLSWFAYAKVYKPLTSNVESVPTANPYSVPITRVESALSADTAYTTNEDINIPTAILEQLPMIFFDADASPVANSEGNRPADDLPSEVTSRPNLEPTSQPN